MRNNLTGGRGANWIAKNRRSDISNNAANEEPRRLAEFSRKLAVEESELFRALLYIWANCKTIKKDVRTSEVNTMETKKLREVYCSCFAQSFLNLHIQNRYTKLEGVALVDSICK
ncbi:50S ribosomal protein [Dirofilaria immitis]